MNKSVKFIIAALIIVGAVVYLLTTSLSQDSVYYLEVSEVIQHPDKYTTKGIRVSGRVQEGYESDLRNKKLVFSIKDEIGGEMRVTYNDLVPDTFEPGIDVIVEGRYDKVEKMFYAKILLTKCPSKYDPEELDNGSQDNKTEKQ